MAVPCSSSSSLLFSSLSETIKSYRPLLPKSPFSNPIANLTKTHLGPNLNLHLHSKTPLFHLFCPPNQRITTILPHNINPIKSLFTGIVEEMGEIKHLGYGQHGGFTMRIAANTVLTDVNLGDSISVNGACLTVTDFDTSRSEFSVGLSPETLRKTSLNDLRSGSVVNLERALSPSSRMGGHFVQGHVDGTGEIVSLEPEGDSLWVKVKAPPELLKYIVPKGFIAVDGTSLTVVGVFEEEGCFNFMLVAYSQQKVVIPLKKVGEKVNLEVDILGKYVERLLKSGFNDPVVSS